MRLAAYRGTLSVVGPTRLIDAIDGQQLCRSDRNGNYYLRMTLAIQHHASEVWHVLRAVKTEFGNFGKVLEKMRTHLDHATKSIDATGVRTRAIERQLRGVEERPGDAAAEALHLDGTTLDLLHEQAEHEPHAV